MADKAFVKASTTTVSPEKSQQEVQKLLRRYGASAINVMQDIAKREIVVSFIVPNSAEKDAPNVPVKIPVSVSQVYHAMYGMPTRWKDGGRVHDPNGYDRRKLEQAERVGWRNLVLWLDAALSAATIGLQTITEAFFAHAVVGASGERMIEVVEQFQSELGVGTQRLLTSEVSHV